MNVGEESARIGGASTFTYSIEFQKWIANTIEKLRRSRWFVRDCINFFRPCTRTIKISIAWMFLKKPCKHILVTIRCHTSHSHLRRVRLIISVPCSSSVCSWRQEKSSWFPMMSHTETSRLLFFLRTRVESHNSCCLRNVVSCRCFVSEASYMFPKSDYHSARVELLKCSN